MQKNVAKTVTILFQLNSKFSLFHLLQEPLHDVNIKLLESHAIPFCDLLQLLF
jgi:hypothetical protein